jgi:hypothetical protein
MTLAQLLALLNSTKNMFIIESIRHEFSKENYFALLLAGLLALLMIKNLK